MRWRIVETKDGFRVQRRMLFGWVCMNDGYSFSTWATAEEAEEALRGWCSPYVKRVVKELEL